MHFWVRRRLSEGTLPIPVIRTGAGNSDWEATASLVHDAPIQRLGSPTQIGKAIN